jgi:signal transduction histidine kinase
MQREFINIAAHELRTPIVPILGFSEVLNSKAKERRQKEHRREELGQLQEQEEMLEIILRNADRLHQLTEDILDVTRIESQTLKLRKERFNVHNLIVDAAEDSRKRIANGNVKVVYELANNTTIVEADRRRLRQVISNLLDNAIKFTKEGTITVTTTIMRKEIESDNGKGEEEEGGGASAEEVVISVKDTGSGIDPELMPRLFTKFATKSYRGTGLGLYISKSIIEAHSGRMWARNNNNNNNEFGFDLNRQLRGAIFYFTLPVVSTTTTELRTEEKKEAKVIND